MRSIAPNTRTKPTLQEGQAIVLIALLILVLFGMLGLAVDSGRGYVDRRDQQTAVDAAALAAGDWYDNFPDRVPDLASKTIPGALAVYESNLRLYSGCTLGPDTGPFATALGYPQDNWTATCGSYTLTITAINTQFNGYQFEFHSYHQLPLAFIQIFGGSPTIDIEADATSIVGNQRQTPALLTLNPNGPCTTWVHGSGQLTLYGDAYSNGPVCVDSSFGIAGNCYAASGNCNAGTYLCYTPNVGNPYQATPCHAGDVQGAPIVPAPSLPDPSYLAPEQQYYTGAGGMYGRGTWTEMTPGNYTGFSLSGGGCYFLDAGVYTWNGGYSSHGGLVSNELKPPGEANYTQPGDTSPTGLSFWGNGGGCDGSFTVAPVPLPPGSGIKHKNTTGPWGVVLTSVRFDRFLDPTMGANNPCYNSPGCYRESAPSICQPVSTSDAANLGINVTIVNNTPGAEYYNVYVDPLGCEHYSPPDSPCPNAPEPCPNPANFTFYGTFLAPGWTDAGLGYASTLGVGPWTGTLSGGRLGWAPGCAVPAVTICNINGTSLNTPASTAVACAYYNSRTTQCPVPAWETAPECFPQVCASASSAPQENAPMALEWPNNPPGDIANENYCVVTPTSPNGDPSAPCSTAKITPGAVQFYFPGGNNCLDQNGNGSTHVFSGEQYNWIVIYQVPSTSLSPSQPAGSFCNPDQKMNGSSFTQYIGTIYSPTNSWDILGSNVSPLAGQLIAWSAQVAGSGNAGILFNPNYSPAPPAARLIN